MQGLHDFVPTSTKIEYINALLDVGFDTIDFGSFVSPKAIPQMKDTATVLENLKPSASKLLAIVANERGANEAGGFDRISYLGFPLSVSETFQVRNTNKSIKEAIGEVEKIQTICMAEKKELVVYLSMGFGNPYGDPYDEDILGDYVKQLADMGITIISLADTVGVATPEQIKSAFNSLMPEYPLIEFGAHLHANPYSAVEKIQAVIDTGCNRIDGTILGYGGCPMAKDELTGNLDSIMILNALKDEQKTSIDHVNLTNARKIATELFSTYK